MKMYWKVHIDNFDSFVKYILKKYKKFRNSDLIIFKHYYKNFKYLYLAIDNRFIDSDECTLSYENYSKKNKDWFDNNLYDYMGEYYGRMDKLIKLNNISKL